MKNSRWAGAFAIATVLATGAPTFAQSDTTPPGGNFDRGGNISVSERAISSHQGGGFQRGAFIFQPVLKAGIEHNDNIFAASAQTESDMVVVINPTLDVVTTWSRHALNFNVGAVAREYADFDDESVLNWNAGALARIDVVRGTYLEGGIGYEDLTEPRTSAGAAGQAAEPIEYDTMYYSLEAAREYGRWRASIGAQVTSWDYDDAPLFGGGTADQDFRDRNSYSYTLRGDYAVSPDTSVFLAATFIEEDYDFLPPAVPANRNSSGYTASVGTDFDIRGTARGQLSIGYTEREYDNPAFGDTSGLSFGAGVEWFPTLLTTIGIDASRSIQESAITGSSGLFNTELAVSLDHELRRDLVVAGRVVWAEDEYNGLDRNDERTGLELSATYYAANSVGISAYVRHDQQDSGGTAGIQDYDRNIIGINLVWRP